MMSGPIARLLLLCCLVVQTFLTPLALIGTSPAVAAGAPGAPSDLPRMAAIRPARSLVGTRELAAPDSAVVAATTAISPTSAVYQQTVTLTGTNFGAAETVKVYWGSTSTTPLSSTTTGATGSFVDKFSVPQAASGAHTVIAVGQSSARSASVSLHVKPKTALRAASGAQGALDVLSGYGFGASETVTGTWNLLGGTVLGTALTNSAGTFSSGSAITWTVPLSPTGSYKVYARGGTSKVSAYSAFKVVPALRVAPGSGRPGTTATITGTGYGAAETVTLSRRRRRWARCRSAAAAGAARRSPAPPSP